MTILLPRFALQSPGMKLLRKTQIVLFTLLVSATLWPQADPRPSNSGQSNAAPVSIDKVRISAAIAEHNLTHKVIPPYPDYAKAYRIQGAVTLHAVIDKEGRVVELKLIGGHPALVENAIEAVKQWRYRPFLLDGKPVDVETTITVNFKLANMV